MSTSSDAGERAQTMNLGPNSETGQGERERVAGRAAQINPGANDVPAAEEEREAERASAISPGPKETDLPERHRESREAEQVNPGPDQA